MAAIQSMQQQPYMQQQSMQIQPSMQQPSMNLQPYIEKIIKTIKDTSYKIGFGRKVRDQKQIRDRVRTFYKITENIRNKLDEILKENLAYVTGSNGNKSKRSEYIKEVIQYYSQLKQFGINDTDLNTIFKSIVEDKTKKPISDDIFTQELLNINIPYELNYSIDISNGLYPYTISLKDESFYSHTIYKIEFLEGENLLIKQSVDNPLVFNNQIQFLSKVNSKYAEIQRA